MLINISDASWPHISVIMPEGNDGTASPRFRLAAMARMSWTGEDVRGFAQAARGWIEMLADACRPCG